MNDGRITIAQWLQWLPEHKEEYPETPIITWYAKAIFVDNSAGDDRIPSIADSVSAQAGMEERVSTQALITDHEGMDTVCMSSCDTVSEVLKLAHDPQTETPPLTPELEFTASLLANKVHEGMDTMSMSSCDTISELLKLAHDPQPETPPLTPEQTFAASLWADEVNAKPMSLPRSIEIPLLSRDELIPQKEASQLSPEQDTQADKTLESPPAGTDALGTWDILSGRGATGNNHTGNKRYRNFVSKIRPLYKGISKRIKTKLCKLILEGVEEYGGRFVKEFEPGRYSELNKEEARDKISQALREKPYKWTGGEGDVEKRFEQEARRIVEQG